MTTDSTTIIDTFQDHEGAYYLVLLQSLHAALNPRSYLEIGSASGASLALASCKSIAIDPNFRLGTEFFGSKPACLLFKMGSDEFFADNDPVAIFGRPIDLAFIDGMHLAEFLLRDFINTERCSRPNSVIVMHDCLPVDTAIARRPESYGESRRHPGWWTGDVWKVLPILAKYRPELAVYAIDAAPTGLVLITGLNPKSTILADNYFTILREIREMGDDSLCSLASSLTIHSSAEFGSAEQISRFCWL